MLLLIEPTDITSGILVPRLWMFGFNWATVGKVSEEPALMTDIILPMQEPWQSLPRPLSVAHSLRPCIYSDTAEETLGKSQ